METITRKSSCMEGLNYLLDKYNVTPDCAYNLVVDEKPCLILGDNTKEVVLLNWHFERKFKEIKNLLINGTMGDICVIRVCNITESGSSIKQQMYRELDLCEWLGGSIIQSIYTVMNGSKTANLVVHLENDVICTVEVAATLPTGSDRIERHEINTTRGVVSDQVVDTQIPQKSIYVYNDKKKPVEYQDTDFELYGLSQNEITVVRSAFEALKCPETISDLQARDCYLNGLVKAAFKSAAEGKKIFMEVNNR